MDDSEAALRAQVAQRRHALGAKHQDTLEAVCALATLLQRQGKLALAGPLLHEARSGFQETLGERHPSTMACSTALAELLLLQGKQAEADRARHRWVAPERAGARRSGPYRAGSSSPSTPSSSSPSTPAGGGGSGGWRDPPRS